MCGPVLFRDGCDPSLNMTDITAAQADQIIGFANQIRATLGCS